MNPSKTQVLRWSGSGAAKAAQAMPAPPYRAQKEAAGVRLARRRLLCLAFLLCCIPGARSAQLPPTLAETGFTGRTGPQRADTQAYSPQYPLWSDAAHKRRWLRLPAGTFIDASKADAWSFPSGTQLWKQFSYGGRPVETRYMQKKRDGTWLFATYVWDAGGLSAALAPERGVAIPVSEAPGGRYFIPSRRDCLACHGSAPVAVLGVSAIQLGHDKDTLRLPGVAMAPGEVDLDALVAMGWVKGLPKKVHQQGPRIVANSALERSALGYLHGNCAHCHNTSTKRVPLNLTLAQRASDLDAAREEVLRSIIGQVGRYGHSDSIVADVIVKPGHPTQSLLLERMRSRQAQTQMPPLGTSFPDLQAVDLLTRWIINMKN
jgi:hypothetical protein